MMLALESSVKTRKEESYAENETHEVMKSGRIRDLFYYYYFRMIEQTRKSEGQLLKRNAIETNYKRRRMVEIHSHVSFSSLTWECIKIWRQVSVFIDEVII